MAYYLLLAIFQPPKQLSQRQTTAPLLAVATANYLLLAIFHLQKQLSQWLQL